ncbi:hypothetical protein Tco_0431894 [Tanacetum coccineum]
MYACLGGGDIYNDPPLLKFYQNNDISPESKFPEPEAPTFAITTRSGISTRDPPFPTLLQSTPTNYAERTTKREGPEGAESRKLSLRFGNETVTFNVRKFMKSKHSRNDYLYCTDHTANIVREQWVDTIDHDGKWTEADEEGDSNEVQAVSFYPRA